MYICKILLPIYFSGLILTSCHKPDKVETSHLEVPIDPDLYNVTIPCNIAPLNFSAKDAGTKHKLKFVGPAGNETNLGSWKNTMKISQRKWKKMLAENKEKTIILNIFSRINKQWVLYKPINIHVSYDSISPYISYRIINPGNILWYEMGIYQRCLENFKETPIMTNTTTNKNCMNCHSFNNYNPAQMVFHMRKYFGGTIIYNNEKLSFVDTKTNYTMSAGVYPSWHPSGKYIAFSVNIIHQQFFAQTDKYEIVQDRASDIILLDTEKNIVTTSPKLSTRRLENTPSWSQDGKYLYYISGNGFDSANYKNIKYDLIRIPFNIHDNEWGEADTLLSSQETGKSMSFPRISPGGRYMLFTMTDYGYFSIFNKESDIYIMDLETKDYHRLSSNSEFVESYPSWSQNGKWIMFVSKRDNNMFSRPWFCHLNDDGSVGKPFVLPQKKSGFYDDYIYNFNRPEFIAGEVEISQRRIMQLVTRNKAVPSTFDRNVDIDALSGATKISMIGNIKEGTAKFK